MEENPSKKQPQLLPRLLGWKVISLIILIIISAALIINPYFFLGQILGIKQFVRSLPQQQAAKQIPEYRNAQMWDLKGECLELTGGGPCEAEIYFKTDDDADTVFSFYKENLVNDGWIAGEEMNLLDLKGNQVPSKHIDFQKGNDSVTLSYFHEEDQRFNYHFRVLRK